MNQLTPAMQIPKYLCYVCLPVGGILGAFRFLEYGWRRVQRFKKDPTDRRLVVVQQDEEGE